jgi:hypothetical protein
MEGLTFVTWILMAASFGMTAIASVGSYQALFVMPEYLASPPASLRRYRRGTPEDGVAVGAWGVW